MGFSPTRDASPHARDVRRVQVAAIVITGATLAAYANSFPGIFVFDDASSVIENAAIRHLWPLTSVLSPPSSAGVGGRPLANLTLAANHAISGLNPWSYHAFNLTIHLLAALTLLGVMRRTFIGTRFDAHVRTAAIPLAAATALLWAVHPLPTIAVNYVSQRTELLVTLFYLTTLYGFIRAAEGGGRRWQVFSLLSFLLGLASKESMITAPVLVGLYDRTFVSRTWREAWRSRTAYYVALMGMMSVAAAVMITSRLAERGVGFTLGVTAQDYAFTQGGAVLTYLKLALWPEPLVFDYGWSFERSGATAVARVLACALLIIASVIAWRRQRLLGLAGCAVFLLLAPTSSIIPIIQQPIAENRMDLPLAVIVATGVAALFVVLRERAIFTMAAILVAFIVLTAQRNLAYKTEVALWSDTIAKRPESARAHGNLAAALLRADRPAEAIHAAETALRFLPTYPEAQQNLALALARSGRLTEALGHYELALRIDPNSADIHYNFGEALAQSGRNADAAIQFETALQLNPREAKAHNNLSVVLLPLNRAREAAEHARTALQLDPEFAEAHYNLGNAQARLGDRAGAITSYETAIRLQPAFARAHNNLGVLRLQAGDAAGAIANFEAAVQIDPAYVQARQNLERAKAGSR